MMKPNVTAVVQFLHPGDEHRPKPGARLLPWEAVSHGRKFMEWPGVHLNATGKPLKGGIRFWAEYEPPSTAKVLLGEGDDLPRFVQEPLLPPGPRPPKGANTDPWIWGDFFYSNCQQWRDGHSTQLRFLEKGSLILFGSNKNSAFHLDTCVVVKDYLDFTSIVEVGKRWTLPPLFREEVLNPIASDSQCGKDAESLRLYKGATWSPGGSGPFSFVPCSPVASPDSAFPRPAIHHKFLSDTQRQGFGYQVVSDVTEVWKNVCAQVLAADLSLGVHVDELRSQTAR